MAIGTTLVEFQLEAIFSLPNFHSLTILCVHLCLCIINVFMIVHMYHEPRQGVHNRDREKILQTSNRAHKMQLHCTTLLAFKYAENLVSRSQTSFLAQGVIACSISARTKKGSGMVHSADLFLTPPLVQRC